MRTPAPDCYDCKHFNKDDVNISCKAYPEKIPRDIFIWGKKHIKPRKGDNGIQFEKV